MAEKKTKFPRGKHPNSQANLRRGPGKGRPKGAKNKVPLKLADEILKSFEDLGGAKYLEKLAKSGHATDRAAYVSILSRVLPKEVNASVKHSLEENIEEILAAGRKRVADAKERAVPMTKDSRHRYYHPDDVVDVEPVEVVSPHSRLTDQRAEHTVIPPLRRRRDG